MGPVKSFNFFRIDLVNLFAVIFDDEILNHVRIGIGTFITPESLVGDGWNA